MITDKQFSDWAQSSTKSPVLLVEITHKTGKIYLSNYFYFTGSGEVPEHVSYDVCLKQSVVVERTLDADSLGAIRVYNDGSLDHWLDLLFIGYEIVVFIGDKSWARSSFRRQYKAKVESFTQLSATSYEFKSTLTTSVVQTSLYSVNTMIIAGSHSNYMATIVGTNNGKRLYRIAMSDQYDQSNVQVRYNGSPADITWVNQTATNDAFYVNDYPLGSGQVQFDCTANKLKFKEFFAYMCSKFGQAYNAANLAAYPIDPDITFYLNENMSFQEFLTLSLETIGALKWVNDSSEIELYRKELPDLVDDNNVNAWITPQDRPIIKAITTEEPASVVLVQNPTSNHLTASTPRYYAFNSIDLDYPHRTKTIRSFAKNTYSIPEGERLADLLSITRRTYSISISRTSPELFIGAIVNVHSPKDRWESNGKGLNALVVGFTQSYKQNKSELIVWR